MDCRKFVLRLSAAAALTMLAASAAGAEEIQAGSSTFQDLVIVDNDDFTMEVSCDDEDTTDGYTWTVHFENKSKNTDFAVSLQSTALGDVMCETDEWELSGWTIKAGGKKDAFVTWPEESLQNAQIGEITSAAFELKVYRNNHFQEADAMCVDDLFRIVMSEEDEKKEEAAPEETETEVSESTVSTGAEKDPVTGQRVLLDNLSYKAVLASEGEDNEGLPVWHMILENRTGSTVMFELDNSVINGWVITPYWTQVVLPGTTAYSDISWWNMDVDPELVMNAQSASFDILVWDKQKGWNDTYTGVREYPVSFGTDAKAATQAAQEEETTEEADVQEAAEQTSDTQESTEEEGIVFYSGEEGEIALRSITPDYKSGYAMLGIYLENAGARALTFAISEAEVDGQDVDLTWSQKMPASSKKNSTVYVDMSRLKDDPSPKALELTISAGAGSDTLFEETFEVDLNTMKLLSGQTVQGGSDQEQQAAPETDQYTDADTIRNLQAALKNAGYDVGEADGNIGDATRAAIRSYREARGLPEGDTVDDSVLYALGVADSATYKLVQEALVKEGYDVGEPDGLTGSRSRDAIAAYRQKYGIGGEGVDEQLLFAMGIVKESSETAEEKTDAAAQPPESGDQTAQEAGNAEADASADGTPQEVPTEADQAPTTQTEVEQIDRVLAYVPREAAPEATEAQAQADLTEAATEAQAQADLTETATEAQTQVTEAATEAQAQADLTETATEAQTQVTEAATEAQAQADLTEAATEAQTQVTEAATEVQTQATGAETEAQAEAGNGIGDVLARLFGNTAKSDDQAVTEAQTEAAVTEAQTEAAATEAQTEAAQTEAVTEAAQTEAATEEAQTEAVTEAQTEAPKLAPETDVYTDVDTIRNMKAGLRELGYELDRENNEMTQELRGIIAQVRTQEALPEGNTIDDDLLFFLNVADSATYKAMQEALTAAGYDCGEADGLVGSKTKDAVESFREANNLEGSGIDEELLKALGVRK